MFTFSVLREAVRLYRWEASAREEPCDFGLAQGGYGSMAGRQLGKLQNWDSGRAARAKALVTYQEFFTLWKDADPVIPVLKQANAEHAKLQ